MAGFNPKDFWTLTPREWGVWMAAALQQSQRDERKSILQTWAGVHYDLDAVKAMIAEASEPMSPEHLDQMLTHVSAGLIEVDVSAYLETKRQRGQ